MEVLCPHCHGNFCLEHRHQVQHGCPALAARESLAHRVPTRGEKVLVKVEGQSPKSWSAEKGRSVMRN